MGDYVFIDIPQISRKFVSQKFTVYYIIRKIFIHKCHGYEETVIADIHLEVIIVCMKSKSNARVVGVICEIDRS